MYVNRLIEFAGDHEAQFPPMGYKQKKIDWYVYLNKKGFTFTPVEIELSVPDVARSSNTKPILIVDKPDYVFGLYDNEGDKERSEARHEAYKSLLDQCILETDDQAVKLLRKHLDQPVNNFPADLRLNHFVAFCIHGENLLHDAPSVRKFWGEYVLPKVHEKSTVLPCMFCQQERPVMERHSIDFLIGPDRTKMISANKNAYETHGLKNSLSAPTCFVCEQKYGKALEHMLRRYKDRNKSGGPHMFRIGEITYVYWVRAGKQIDIGPFTSPRDEQTEQDIADLLRQTFQGVKAERNVNGFCLLVLTSNKGRLVVRNYVEDSIGNIEHRIKAFFDAQNIGHKRYYGIYTLAATMYTEPRNQMQKYALEEWVNWFLYGRKLSGRILISVLKRIQAAGLMYPQHAAAIQSWLVSQEGGLTIKMDFEERIGYKIGRVFAILEKIHREAIASKNTIASKFFGSASTTPNAVMGLLIRNSQYHLAKLKNDIRKRRIANGLENDLKLAIQKINEFPKTLYLDEQGDFAIGYYHELQRRYGSRNQNNKEDVKQ